MATITIPIQVNQGAAAGLPTLLSGELGWTTDTHQLYVGDGSANHLISQATGTVTSVAAGAGLTGGTITTSGTIAVSYGTSAGTSCQGNDSRLSDSRAPSGSAGGDLTGSYPNPTIAADKVTYAKMQNVSAASKLLGRGDSSPGDPQEITLGGGLSMSGTTLSASGGGSSLTISDPVSGGTNNEVLYIDGSGNLGCSANLQFTPSFGLVVSDGTNTVTLCDGGSNALTITAGNIALGAAGGTKVGITSTQLLALWGATPVVQPATTGTTSGHTLNGGSAVGDQDTFTGNTGSAAYTIGDIVLALKQAGILAA